MTTMNSSGDKPVTWLNNPHGWFHRVFINEAILISLVFFCLIGLAYTNFASAQSYHYWLWMIPVFAIAAIISEWSRYTRHEISGKQFIRQQILHWGAVYIAIRTVFLLHEIGRLNNDATALTLMTVIALSVFLAGVYIGWRFLLLGVFITLATLVVAYMEAYMWVLLPTATGIVAIGVAVAWWQFRKLLKTTGT